jgi:hypothetical protein
MSISGSKQSLQIAKRNLSNFNEYSVVSILIEILRAYKSSFHSILHVECSACRLERRNKSCKSQNAIFQISTKTLLFPSGLRYYGVQKLFPLDSTGRTYCMSILVSKQSLQIAKRNLSNFDENSVISFRIEILRRSKTLCTPFCTPNVVHVDFSVETIPAYRKTQSFKFRRSLCHFVPDSDVSTFKCCFHSILHAPCSACRFQCRKHPCKSQSAIFQSSSKILLFRSRLRCFDV